MFITLKYFSRSTRQMQTMKEKKSPLLHYVYKYIPLNFVHPPQPLVFCIINTPFVRGKNREAYLWWFEGVVGREVNREKEDTTLIRRVGRTHDGGLNIRYID